MRKLIASLFLSALLCAGGAQASTVTCNGQSSDNELLQGVIDAGGQITIAGHCAISGLLVADASKVGIIANGANLDCSMMATDGHPCIDIEGGPNSYADRLFQWHLTVAGPGNGTNSVGVKVGAPDMTIYLTAHDFGTNVLLANNAYDDHFPDAIWYNATTGISCPAGISNAGVGIDLAFGEIFNSKTSIYNAGNCEFILTSERFDGLSGPAFTNLFGVITGSGRIEYTRPYSGVVMINGSAGNGSNSTTHIQMHDSWVQIDPVTDVSKTPVTIAQSYGSAPNGPYVDIDKSYFYATYDSTKLNSNGIGLFSYTGNVNICRSTTGWAVPSAGRYNYPNVGACP